MQESKHTPGPWLYAGRFGFGHLIHPNVAVAYGNNGSPSGLFNARLISASPELLSAAKEVMALLEEYGAPIVPHLLDTDMNAGQRLRDAIAKAEAS